MNISEKGIKLIKSFEGVRLTAYKCPAGVWTIGYGHTAGVKKGQKITQVQADEFLKADLKIYESYVTNLRRVFNQNEFDALVSFCYNCGQGNLQSLCKNRSKPQIANAILKYNKANGKELAGLTKRRKAEQELFLLPIGQKEIKQETKKEELPYKVKTKVCLVVRKGPGTNYDKIRVTKLGDTLTVWAKQGNWGKNGDEWFCLDFCQKI